MPGKLRREIRAIPRASSHAPPVGIGRGDGAGHHIAGASSPRGSASRVKRRPVAVHQQRAGAAHRLGDERSGVDAGKLERGGMELEELEVTELGAGFVLPGPSRRRWRPGGWSSRRRAGRRRRSRAPRRMPECRARARCHRVPSRPRPDPSRTHQPPDFGVLEQLDLWKMPHDCGQAAHQHGAGPVAAGVDDSRPGVRRLEPEPEPAIRRRGRTRRPAPAARGCARVPR